MLDFPAGIYGILPSGLQAQDMLARAEAAMQGGLGVIQYRNKGAGFQRARKQALALRSLCDRYDCRLIVNDSIQLARACRADGVHLGRSDVGDMNRLRDELGESIVLGVTCRADAAWAKQALACGADYVSFGAVFASQSKPEVPVMGLPRLHKARQMFAGAKLCAIGGINEENILQVKATGVDTVAVISALFAADNITARCRQLIELWNSPAAV